MGIDVDGKLFVGSHYKEFSDVTLSRIEDEFYGDIFSWAEEFELGVVSPYFDCCLSECYYGFLLKEVKPVSSEFGSWCTEVQSLAERYKLITGADAKIIGMQHVY